MGRKLYVGNLPYTTQEQDLQELFERVGPVESVTVMRDMATGRARGFGFVEMATDDGAQKAISELHESQLGGRTHFSQRALLQRRCDLFVLDGDDLLEDV